MAKRKVTKKKASSKKSSPARAAKPASSGKGCGCYDGLWLIILGIIVILNGWRAWVTWPQFIGIFMIICGLAKYAKR